MEKDLETNSFHRLEWKELENEGIDINFSDKKKKKKNNSSIIFEKSLHNLGGDEEDESSDNDQNISPTRKIRENQDLSRVNKRRIIETEEENSPFSGGCDYSGDDSEKLEEDLSTKNLHSLSFPSSHPPLNDNFSPSLTSSSLSPSLPISSLSPFHSISSYSLSNTSSLPISSLSPFHSNSSFSLLNSSPQSPINHPINTNTTLPFPSPFNNSIPPRNKVSIPNSNLLLTAEGNVCLFQ